MRSDTHKVLHPIASRPLLLHLLDRVDALGAERRVVVVGKGREQVEAAIAGRDAAIAVQAEQKGTGHAVQQAAAALDGYDGPVLDPLRRHAVRRGRDARDGCSTGSTATTAPAWSCSARARPIPANTAGSSSARATASRKWSSIATRPRTSARSTCAIRA